MQKTVSDYEINGAVRRELSARGLNMMNLRYRCSGGTVEIGGALEFKEPKSPAQIIKDLFLLESSIMGIRGVKRVKMDFEDFEKKSGKWAVNEKAIEKKESAAPPEETKPESD